MPMDLGKVEVRVDPVLDEGALDLLADRLIDRIDQRIQLRAAQRRRERRMRPLD